MYPNGYYNYRKHRKNAKEKEEARIKKIIKRIYHEAEGRPGYRQMRELLKQSGINLCKSTVRKYMHDLKLRSVTRKGNNYHYSKGKAADQVFENILKQNFRADHPNEKWCIDFTYVFFGNHLKRYNCTIIDLYERRVVASVNGRHIDTELAIATVTKALKSIGSLTGMILHSDRGSQFTSKAFCEFCKEHGITQSMSRPGCPYDNAPMERYFNTLKSELLNHHKYSSEEELFSEINRYAYEWYNEKRPHTYNEGLPPAKVA